MFADILKALEFLKTIVTDATSPDTKRRQVAKELVGICSDIETVHDYGTKIVGALSESDSPLGCSDISSRLLEEQGRALQHLLDRLKSGSVGNLLQIHFPGLRTKLVGVIHTKADDIWLLAEWLGGTNDHECRQRIEAYFETLPSGVHLRDSLIRPRTRLDDCVIAIATKSEVHKAREALDQIVRAGDSIRRFVLEHFKFEDVL